MSRRRRHSRGLEDDIKYAPGVGARVPASQRPLSILERTTLAHVAIFLIGATWASAASSFVTPLAWWGSLGVLLALTALQDRDGWRDGWMRPLLWLWPFLAFNVLELLASLNPTAPQPTETASPTGTAVALRALWIFDGVWIACFNLALIIRQRRALRLLLLIAVTNAVVLAIFGTVQKFLGARGIFFDSRPAPDPDFFATLLNRNHWGAFIVLMIAAGIALVWHYARRREARDFFYSPANVGVTLIAALASTLPISLAHSGFALAIVLIGAALVHGCLRMIQRRRQFRESVAVPVAGAVAAAGLGLAAIWFVISENPPPADSGQRAILARDTWEQAKSKPWLGAGMGSFPRGLRADSSPSVGDLSAFNRDVGSDWLRALAEHGLIGGTLLALCALVPLLRLRPRHLSSPLPVYLLAGCALILIVAGFELPFENFAVTLSWWLCFFTAVQYARLQDREMPGSKSSTAVIATLPTADCSAMV